MVNHARVARRTITLAIALVAVCPRLISTEASSASPASASKPPQTQSTAHQARETPRDTLPDHEGSHRRLHTSLVACASLAIVALAGTAACLGISIIRRKRVEEDLRESREQLQFAIDAAEAGIMDWDLATGEMRASPRCFTMLDYEPGEIGSDPDTWTALTHPDDSEKRQRSIEGHLDGFSSQLVCEFRMRAKSGQWRWILSVGKIVKRDDEGRPLRMVSLRTDITDRKSTTEALRQSEERFRLVSEQTGQIVYDYDQATGAIKWGGAIERNTGYTPEEFEAVDIAGWEEHVHPDDRAEAVRLVEASAATGAPYQAEYRLRRKDGVYRVVQDNGVMLRNAIGQPYRMVGTLSDITERKEAQAALRVSETNYREVFDAAGDAIFVHDAATGRVLDVNQAALQMFGCPREQLLDVGADKMSLGTPPYSTKEAMEWVRKTLEHGPQTFEWRSRRADGELFWTEVSLRATRIGGDERVLALVRDISARREAQDRLRMTQSIIDHASEGVHWVDAHGRLVYVNEAMCATLGYAEDQLLKMSLFDLVPGYTQERLADRFQQIRELGSATFEAAHLTSDGRALRVDVTATYVDLDGDQFLLCLARYARGAFEAEASEAKIEQDRTRFYRETILTVTEGKLQICDRDTTEPYVRSAEVESALRDSADVPSARVMVEGFCSRKGLSEGQIGGFRLGIGEALANAIKHAPRGHVYAGVADGCAWVAVEDNGPGLDSLIPSRAALQQGLSGGNSIGLGYSIMLAVADKMMLCTDQTGTTVILMKQFVEASPGLSLEQFPDTWQDL